MRQHVYQRRRARTEEARVRTGAGAAESAVSSDGETGGGAAATAGPVPVERSVNAEGGGNRWAEVCCL